jgi:hypothetical protein
LYLHNVAKHCLFDARRTVVPNTAIASASAVEIKMATFTGAERDRRVFGFEETKSATQVERKFHTQCRREPVFLTLQWNSLRTDSFEFHESQRDLRLEKLVFHMLLCGHCCENVYI